MNPKASRYSKMGAADQRLFWAASVAGVVALSSMLAFAAETPQPSRNFEVGIEKFREQCQDPLKGEVQRAPQDIRLVCRSREVTWVAANPGEVPLRATRTVSTALISDKFRVAEVSRNVETAPRVGRCPRFQEVVETFTTEVPVSCDEVLHHKGPLEEICNGKVDESKDKNSEAVQVVPTGRSIDTCPAALSQAG